MGSSDQLAETLRRVSSTASSVMLLVNPACAMIYSDATAAAIETWRRWEEEKVRERIMAPKVLTAADMYPLGEFNQRSASDICDRLNEIALQQEQFAKQHEYAKLKQRIGQMPTKITRNHR